MRKRGQVTLFIILGLIVVIIFAIYLYTSGLNSKRVLSSKAQNLRSNAVKDYAESCIKIAAEDALFNKIGLHGGYLNPDGDATYGETGAINPSAVFQGEKVPYYLEGTNSGNIKTYNKFVPSMDTIKKKIENYVIVEFEKCFKANTFGDIGINITKPEIDYKAINFDFSKTDVRIDVGINQNDVSISLDYPIVVREREIETELESFSVILPIRLKSLFDSSAIMVENIKNKQPDTYDISLDCSSYDKNGLTNIYLKSSDDGSGKIVQLVDFSTYNSNYVNSYIFQFAVKNVNIQSDCVG